MSASYCPRTRPRTRARGCATSPSFPQAPGGHECTIRRGPGYSSLHKLVPGRQRGCLSVIDTVTIRSQDAHPMPRYPSDTPAVGFKATVNSRRREGDRECLVPCTKVGHDATLPRHRCFSLSHHHIPDLILPRAPHSRRILGQQVHAALYEVADQFRLSHIPALVRLHADEALCF